MGIWNLINIHMITWSSLILFLASFTISQSDTELAFCDFSKVKAGKFGDFAAPGFPEYHYVPRQFTDGWDIVNNRGPEEWYIFESDGKKNPAVSWF